MPRVMSSKIMYRLHLEYLQKKRRRGRRKRDAATAKGQLRQRQRKVNFT